MPHFFDFQDLPVMLNITQGRTESLYRVETCRSIRRSPWGARGNLDEALPAVPAIPVRVRVP